MVTDLLQWHNYQKKKWSNRLNETRQKSTLAHLDGQRKTVSATRSLPLCTSVMGCVQVLPWVTGIQPCKSGPGQWLMLEDLLAAPHTDHSFSSVQWQLPTTTAPPGHAWRCPRQHAATGGAGWLTAGGYGPPPCRTHRVPPMPAGRRSWMSVGGPELSQSPQQGSEVQRHDLPEGPTTEMRRGTSPA